MFNFRNIQKDVIQAYRKLKQAVYYDTLNLFQRAKIAEFESDKEFENKLKDFAAELKQYLASGEITNVINSKLNEIKFNILPKNVLIANGNTADNTEGLFITNVRTCSKGYEISSVNYFIDLPVELMIVDILWCGSIGILLDKKLSKNCYSSRLEENILKKDDSSAKLFKIYHTQYNMWRDNAIKIAQRTLEEDEQNVAIFSMDIKQCFYHVDLKETEFFENFPKENISDMMKYINVLLINIFKSYYKKVRRYIELSHPESISCEYLPIGLFSSQVLCNHYLNRFDHDVIEKLNPIYYGRYVDDIMIVVKCHKKVNSFKEFTINHLIKNDLLHKKRNSVDNNSNIYRINGYKFLEVQKDKLILQYFDKHHAKAGLQIFKKQIDKNASAFRFLPVGDIEQKLDEVAYDILYDGSTNKFRSIVGLSENDNELAKYLATQITAHKLSSDGAEQVVEQLFAFFQGINCVQFYRIWEKVYSFLVIKKFFKEMAEFDERIFDVLENITLGKQICSRITKNTCSKENFVATLKDKMNEFAKYSMAITLGLLSLKETRELVKYSVFDTAFKESLLRYRIFFRKSNLIRHNLVHFPLYNYTDSKDNLSEPYKKTLTLNALKIKYSPRFIHFDEYQLYNLMNDTDNNQDFDEALSKYVKKFSLESIISKFKKDGGWGSGIKIDEGYHLKELKIAVANIKVLPENIQRAYDSTKTPNLSSKRQNELYSIINAAEKEHCDILVLPEVSIPCEWLPFMVAHARRNKMGIIFGLEHQVINEEAFNRLVTVLPFLTEKKFKTSLVVWRTKNHYAPKEIEDIQSFGLKVPKVKKRYDLFHWRGISLVPYNCFELANIEDRTLFKSELDLLIACVWNRDIKYYSNIMESICRDLHCYTVQANHSEFGDSRILQPSKSETMDILKVKGGENSTILTATLDISKLRNFQFRTYSHQAHDDSFKPTPPGYDKEKAKKRILHQS